MLFIFALTFTIFVKNIQMKAKMDFTAVIEQSEDGWFVGQLEELPEVISQGRDIEEVMENLKDATELIINTRREQLNLS